MLVVAALVLQVLVAHCGCVLVPLLELTLDHVVGVLALVEIEHGESLVEGALLQGVDVLGQVEVVLAPLLELVVEELDHPHYGDLGLHWCRDEMVKELEALNYENVKILNGAFDCLAS